MPLHRACKKGNHAWVKGNAWQFDDDGCLILDAAGKGILRVVEYCGRSGCGLPKSDFVPPQPARAVVTCSRKGCLKSISSESTARALASAARHARFAHKGRASFHLILTHGPLTMSGVLRVTSTGARASITPAEVPARA